MNAQPGVLEGPQEHLDLMLMDAATTSPTTLRRSMERLSAAAAGLIEQHVAADLTVTIGFGAPIVERLAPASQPRGLRAMPTFPRDEFDPTRTQADLAVQVCSNVKFANHAAGKALGAALRGAFAPKAHHQGYTFPGSRGVLGFVDGTANPGQEDRPSIVLIGDEDPPFRDGSYMVFRKIREDVERWDRLTLQEQEDAVGRRKADSAEHPDAPATSHKKKSDVKLGRREMKIYRRSYPFWSPAESGLLFVCFNADLDQYEAVKRSMLSERGGGHDRLEDFYHAVEGGYYFVPPRPQGKGAFIGDFLFA